MKKHKRSLGLLIILIGLVIFMKPYVQITLSKLSEKQSLENYIETEKSIDRKDIEQYNESIRKDAGSLVDPFEVEGFDTPSPIKGIKDSEIFGYVSIPRIGEILPLYLGASQKHLGEGLAQIDGTSLPIGGEDSRSVIAGHRGYYKKPMLRYVDRIKNGDKIYIYADGKRMVYKAYGQEEIYPSENEKLRPIEGKDVVTLLSCTPYPTNRKRILVNFKRDEEAEKEFKRISVNNADKIIEKDMNSEKVDLKASIKNKLIYTTAAISTILFILILIKLIYTFKEEIKNK